MKNKYTAMYKAVAIMGLLFSGSVYAADHCKSMPTNGKIYTIVNEGSDLVLDVARKSKEDGADVVQWSANKGTNQQWKVTDAGNGSWSIRPVHSDKTLDVYNWSSAEKSPIKQWTHYGNDNQQWKLNATENGGIKVVSTYSNLPIGFENTNKGATLLQLADSSSANQRWYFDPVDGNCESSNNNNQTCNLSSQFSWVSTDPLITPHNPDWASIKDPTIVKYNNQYHVFATVFSKTKGYGGIYMNFNDWSQANSAQQFDMSTTPAGSTVAPQVFYFEPHKKWYLIYQWGAKYSTNSDISKPSEWSAPKTLLNNGLGNGIDYWVICDDNFCSLFFSGDDGKLYRSKVSIDNFPNFSGYEVVMSDPVAGHLFEASNVYKVDGTNKYLLLVEAYGPRYFRSWTSTSLDGPWTPLADTQSNPFAGAANVTFSGTKWTDDISHGEMIRSGYNQKMTINACDMEYLYQGVDPHSGVSDYNELPYKLGLIKAK
jgi:hypothetical protein